MPDRREPEEGRFSEESARNLAGKMNAFKAGLSPQEKALFSELINLAETSIGGESGRVSDFRVAASHALTHLATQGIHSNLWMDDDGGDDDYGGDDVGEWMKWAQRQY